MKSSEKKILFRWIKVIVLLYSVIGITLFYLQDKFLFHPTAIDRSIPWKFDMPFEEMDLAMNETDTVNLVKFFPKDSARKGVVLYFHGNRGNIARYVRFVNNFTKHGYEVWIEDYPGFGKSVGERNEKLLYEEAVQVYKLALSKYQADSIIIYGKSLGTGIAAYTAAAGNAKRLILETPYYSIPSLFNCYAPIYPNQRMANYKIPANEYLQGIKYPITIFHGTDDGVIPYRNAKRLKEVLKTTDEFVTIEGGTHRNLNSYPLFKQKLDSLLQL
ncbi:MAG: alpha/beta fold hydrolase [Bacteroidota bacterium]